MAMTEERKRPTDPPTSETPTTGEGSGADLDRRSFFRAFSRDAFQAAAGVVGAADAVRKGTSAAAVELLGLAADPVAGAARLGETMAPTPVWGRSPYRVDGQRVVVLDQRRLPGEIVEVSCHSGAEIATLIREGAVSPGPVLGQLAAYAMAMAAERNIASRPFVRTSTLRGTANALRNARPDSAAIEDALARQHAIWQPARATPLVGSDGHALPEPEVADADTAEPPARDGAAIASAMRGEADTIAFEAMAALGALIETGLGVLPRPEDRPLEVVTIGASGPLSAGVIGTAMGVISAAVAEGRQVHAWVLEARPGRSGTLIGAPELQAADVPVTVIADGAVGWLFRERTIDAVLVAADRIAANGDVAAVVGTYPLTALAARHGVPVHVCALRTTIRTTVADGGHLAITVRNRRELLPVAGTTTPDGVDAREPLNDVTPADLITDYVTESGVLRPPFVGEDGH
jgi:methylthioribose-1-phosphate isomerase